MMAAKSDESIVTTKQGKLKGKLCKSYNGNDYYCFNGIPYAKPPVGDLRFKDPVPYESWTGVRDATKEGNVSYQYDWITFEISGDDDCLFLNLNTPQLNVSGKLLPVMVQIHGGGFTQGSGSSSLFGADFLIEKGVIMISINYRLGVTGFLCTDAVNARGDMGLKDQNMALRWVKDNVKYFGGDPDNITIFGESAGAASVEYHLLSEMSSGLFNKAIMQSASMFIPCTRSPYPIKLSTRLAESLGYTFDSKQSLFDFLNSFESKKLVEAAVNLLEHEDFKYGITFPFVPAINVFKDNKGFINEEPAAILKSGRFNKVPIMAGLCDKEGVFMQYLYKSEQSQQDFLNGNFYEYIPPYLNRNISGGADRLKSVYRKKPEDRNSNEDMIDFVSDLTINGGMWFSLQHRLKNSDRAEYFYNFAHEGKMNYFNFELNDGTGKKMVGVTHADELGYLAPIDDITAEPSEVDVAVRNQMAEMWTNFAKFGDPTPGNSKIKWLPVEPNKFRYLEIKADMTMKTDLFDERRELWKDIYSCL